MKEEDGKGGREDVAGITCRKDFREAMVLQSEDSAQIPALPGRRLLADGPCVRGCPAQWVTLCSFTDAANLLFALRVGACGSSRFFCCGRGFSVLYLGLNASKI